MLSCHQHPERFPRKTVEISYSDLFFKNKNEVCRYICFNFYWMYSSFLSFDFKSSSNSYIKVELNEIDAMPKNVSGAKHAVTMWNF